VSSQKRRGFLKKLSLWGHQANSSSNSSSSNKNGKKMTATNASPPVGRPGEGNSKEAEPERVPRNFHGEDSPLGPAGRRANSVTRIEVAAASVVTAEGDIRPGAEGGGTGDDGYAPAPHLVDPRLSKSLSPSSRKQQSSYSSYIRLGRLSSSFARLAFHIRMCYAILDF
jgi:hypothetical protein